MVGGGGGVGGGGWGGGGRVQNADAYSYKNCVCYIHYPLRIWAEKAREGREDNNSVC
jgi:hypothetical protein